MLTRLWNQHIFDKIDYYSGVCSEILIVNLKAFCDSRWQDDEVPLLSFELFTVEQNVPKEFVHRRYIQCIIYHGHSNYDELSLNFIELLVVILIELVGNAVLD